VLICPSFNVFYYQMSISGRDHFYVLLNYIIFHNILVHNKKIIIVILLLIIIIIYEFIFTSSLQKSSETVSTTLSQKNDLLLFIIIMVTHYYLKHVNTMLLKIRSNLRFWEFPRIPWNSDISIRNPEEKYLSGIWKHYIILSYSDYTLL
jgi:hypothetical protein